MRCQSRVDGVTQVNNDLRPGKGMKSYKNGSTFGTGCTRDSRGTRQTSGSERRFESESAIRMRMLSGQHSRQYVAVKL